MLRAAQKIKWVSLSKTPKHQTPATIPNSLTDLQPLILRIHHNYHLPVSANPRRPGIVKLAPACKIKQQIHMPGSAAPTVQTYPAVVVLPATPYPPARIAVAHVVGQKAPGAALDLVRPRRAVDRPVAPLERPQLASQLLRPEPLLDVHVLCQLLQLPGHNIRNGESPATYRWLWRADLQAICPVASPLPSGQLAVLRRLLTGADVTAAPDK